MSNIHTEQATAAFYERQKEIGVPVVQEISGKPAEDRMLVEKEAYEYLEVQPDQTLPRFIEYAEGLYVTATNPGQGIQVRDVDVFARALIGSIRSPERQLTNDQRDQLSHAVAYARYITTPPSRATYPFSAEHYERLIFSS